MSSTEHTPFLQLRCLFPMEWCALLEQRKDAVSKREAWEGAARCPRVKDLVCGMKGGMTTIATSTPHVAHIHTSETVMGGTPHACPCFIHSTMCATTTTLRDTSEAWWHQHTLTCMAVRCGVWPMLCHSCLHHHLHPPITSPQSISLCHVFTHVCVCDHGIHHAFAFQWCTRVGMGFVM